MSLVMGGGLFDRALRWGAAAGGGAKSKRHPAALIKHNLLMAPRASKNAEQYANS